MLVAVGIRNYDDIKKELDNYKRMVNLMQDVMIELDADGRYCYVSPSYERTYGRGKDIIGKSAFAAIHPEDIDRVWNFYSAGFRKDQATRIEYRNRYPEKGYIWVEARGMTFVNEEGEKRALITVRDISERKRKEEELARSEAKYKLIFDKAPLGIYHMNREGVITHCNDLFVEMIGSSREAIMGMDLQSLKDKDYVDALTKALNGEHSLYEGDYASVTADKVTPIRVFCSPVHDAAGRVSDVVAIVEDTTARKATEAKLRYVEQRWQFAVENSGDGVWDWDIRTGEVGVSDRWLEILGYKPEETSVDYHEFLELVHPYDRSYTIHKMEMLASGKETGYHVMFRMRHKNGEYRHILSIGKVVEWEAGGIGRRAIGIHRDITEQQHAVEALQESERSKSVLLSNLPGMAYRCSYEDGDWKIEYISEGCFELTGYYPGEIKSWKGSLKDIILPKLIIPSTEQREELWIRWKENLKGANSFQMEYPIQTSWGETRWVWERGQFFRNNYNEVISVECFVTDITERKEAEEKNKRLDQLKDEFLANTSHEIKTPLNGMINLTESLLKGSGGELTSLQRQNMELILISSKRLLTLVNDILDFSQIKNKDIKLRLKRVDLHSAVTLTMDLLSYQAVHKNVKLENNVSPTSPALMADENRLSQILFNLIGNALKFTDYGCVSVHAEENNEKMYISIQDTGIGIPKERISEVFNIFEQSGFSPDTERIGTGLGLAITKRLVEMHGGEITVESTVEKGSTFTFSIPLHNQNSANQENNKALETTQHPIPYALTTATGKTEALSNSKGEFRVLVVDDEPVNIHSLANVLFREGMQVNRAASGYRALEMIDSEPAPDLCIVDVMMPGMNGYQLCREIRKRFSEFELPVIFLTARYGKRDLQLGFEAGGNDFLHKPFEETELVARVQTLVQLKKSVFQAMENEMAFLQAQIKPHFLYNVLNTIAAYCEEDRKEAGELILALSKYLRASFSFNNLEEKIKLKQELSLINSYVFIEKSRFPGLKIDIKVRADQSLLLPPMTIQPLIENAIHHGIRHRMTEGRICVEVFQSENGLKVKVWDDGVGMSEEQIDELINNKSEMQGVGLINIHRRLQRIYGKGLEIKSIPGEQTEVSFWIPAVMNK